MYKFKLYDRVTYATSFGIWIVKGKILTSVPGEDGKTHRTVSYNIRTEDGTQAKSNVSEAFLTKLEE